MKTVALITHNASPHLAPSDTFLVEPLKKEGFHAISVAWNDETVNWNNYDVIVLRSCWDYYEQYESFLHWLERIKKTLIPLWNPLDIVKWNSQKTYLRDLSSQGIPIIPTVWNKKGQHMHIKTLMSETSWSDIVIKPTIGARSHNIFRMQTSNDIMGRIRLSRLAKSHDIMIQPFISEITTQGEYSFIFIGNTYSHTVQKLPVMGEFRSNYAHTTLELIHPSKEFITQATHVMEALQNDTLYARVDMVSHNGKLALMELELIEPMLFFDLYPQATTVFAKELKNRIQ